MLNSEMDNKDLNIWGWCSFSSRRRSGLAARMNTISVIAGCGAARGNSKVGTSIRLYEDDPHLGCEWGPCQPTI